MRIMGVAESTACFLRQEIVTGKLAPGTKLNEVELSKRYGVSRPPLREAFRKLEHENLINNVPRRGAFVTELSFEDCRQVYATRSVLEGAAVDILAKTGVRNFSRLSESIEHLDHFVIPKDPDPNDLFNYFGSIAGFHWDLVKEAGNRWLTHCYQSIAATLSRYQQIYLGELDPRRNAIQAHRTIVRAMQEGRFDVAKQVLSDHISSVLNGMLKSI